MRVDNDRARSLRARRATAQLLVRPGSSPEQIVGRLLAVQAQDLRAARLALRARGQGLTATGVDGALEVDRSLVVSWLGRGTLHMAGRDDYPWLLALTAPARFATNRRRLAQEGVSDDDAERAVAVLQSALADDGPLTRTELAERIARRGIRTQGQATPHLLMRSALRGVAVLGPVRGGKQAFVLTRDWLGAPPPDRLAGAEREAALAELARRYLAGHGPALPDDLAAWVGLPLRDARAGLRAIAGHLVELPGGLVDLAGRDPAPADIPARLLPAFDPYLLGWTDRTFAVAAEHARRVHPGGGVVRAVATSDGVAVGTWSTRRRSGRLSVSIDSWAPRETETRAELEAEAADVARFESLALVRKQ